MPLHDCIVEGGCAPGRQAIDGPHPLFRRIGRPAREREHGVVEAPQRQPILRGHGPEERLGGLLQLRHRRRHAAADVHGHDQLQRDILRRKVGNRLRLAVLQHVKCALRQPGDELAAVVGHCDGDLDDVDVDLLGDAKALGPDGAGEAASVGEVRQYPDLPLDDILTGVPVALERRAVHHAHFAAVDEERELRRRARRLDDGAQHDRSGQVRFGVGITDLEHFKRPRGSGWRLCHEDSAQSRPDDRAEHACGHHRHRAAAAVTGTSGPPTAAAAATKSSNRSRVIDSAPRTRASQSLPSLG